MINSLPPHLRKYVVEQNYDQYTPINQASWRYILRQLKSFLAVYAHPSYLEGLEKTGISIEEIPRIEKISEKISAFGWRAIPVSGFIPPAAFMEMQSLGFLPIASAMRSLEHLMYTPAPDIVHEAAGHAPILIQPEFAEYLKQYAQIAKKAIISKEDLEVYEAIRILSDLKEDPTSTEEKITEAQKSLEAISARVRHISEATELGRMNWWTAEYGLIGDLQNPKIFGAGLLSSVGESKWCLSDKVKKVPLSLECIKTSYDITEPQPLLFVAKSFQHLTEVLLQFSETMAFKTGGLRGLQKAQMAKTANTVELNTGIQISGILEEILTHPNSGNPIYLRFSGPTQLSYEEAQIPNQGPDYHSQGYGTALGKIINLEASDIKTKIGQKIELHYESGVKVSGTLVSFYCPESLDMANVIILSFQDCTVTWSDRILFEPAWGIYDLAIGETVKSVFGGPADRASFGELTDFVALKVQTPQYSEQQKRLFQLYQKMRDLRSSFQLTEMINSRTIRSNQEFEQFSFTPITESEAQQSLSQELENLFNHLQKDFPNDWLLLLEIFEVLNLWPINDNLKARVHTSLLELKQKSPGESAHIEDGLKLA